MCTSRKDNDELTYLLYRFDVHKSRGSTLLRVSHCAKESDCLEFPNQFCSENKKSVFPRKLERGDQKMNPEQREDDGAAPDRNRPVRSNRGRLTLQYKIDIAFCRFRAEKSGKKNLAKRMEEIFRKEIGQLPEGANVNSDWHNIKSDLSDSLREKVKTRAETEGGRRLVLNQKPKRRGMWRDREAPAGGEREQQQEQQGPDANEDEDKRRMDLIGKISALWAELKDCETDEKKLLLKGS